jgi:hypothetical protein
MMQQQFLLIILGVIVVGAAIAIGFVLMSDQSSSTNRDNLSADLVSIGVRAQSYYRKPASYGGGEHSFVGFTIDKILRDTATANGSFSLVGSPAGQGPVRIHATGRNTGNDQINPLKIEMLVYPDTISLVSLN